MQRNGQEFPIGTEVCSVRGRRVGHIGKVLGTGGQGAVYTLEMDGGVFALKWYHPSYAAVDVTLRARLSRAIERGPPTDRFLWPIDLIEISGVRSFGYVMRLRDPDYVGMRDLIAAPPKRVTLPLALRAVLCLRIAQAFLELHASGFCYQDINFGNIFFHPKTGDILICDNDNVDVDGAMASVFGTRKFMAPEIVRDGVLPSTNTDLFSMAVLFFYVLHAWHPLDGKAESEIPVMDAVAELNLYGASPLFLFDPSDAANGPVAGMHDPIVARWNALSPRIRNLFLRSFTTGLRQPTQRVLEAEWCAAFSAMAASAFGCPHCGFEHAAYAGTGGEIAAPAGCAACGDALAVPPMLTVGRTLISLAPGQGIPAFHLSPDQAMDFHAIAATVEAHPTNPEITGLRNLTAEPWRATLPDRSTISVPPGRTMRIIHGATISFGKTVGTFIITAPPGAAQEKVA